MWPAEFTPCFTPFKQENSIALNFAFIDDGLLLREDNTLPEASELPAQARAAFTFGTHGTQECRAYGWPGAQAAPTHLKAVGLRDVFSLLPAEFWGMAARARQMLRWDQASRYCGACGTATEALNGEPAKECPACKTRDYPRITPAVMALVRRGDEILLARSPHFRPGMYSALAGFIEAGETVEDCLHREVFEESGIRIKNLRWFASQPWPFPYSLMLAFHADYASGEITPQPGEIEDAGWYKIDNLPGLPAPVSIASRLIEDGVRQIREGSLAQEQALAFDHRNNHL